MKWNWSHFACVSLVHLKFSSVFAFFRFQIFTSLQQGYFRIEAKRRENVFFASKQTKTAHFCFVYFVFASKNTFFALLRFKTFVWKEKKKTPTFASNFSFTLESDRRIHFSTIPCRNTCRRQWPCTIVHSLPITVQYDWFLHTDK